MTGRRDCQCAKARHEHGTARAYAADNCRCTPCGRAHSRALKVNRLRVHRVGAHSELVRALPAGITRRLQALAAAGWSANDLAPLLHTAAPNVIRWRSGRHAWVRPSTLQRVVDVYDRIWDQPPPGRYPVKVRNIAAREGWLPPLAWDDDTIDQPEITNGLHEITDIDYMDVDPPFCDEIAVEQAMRGRRVRLTRPEVAEAHRRLTAQGHSAREIADRLGTTTRTVTRRRAEERVA